MQRLKNNMRGSSSDNLKDSNKHLYRKYLENNHVKGKLIIYIAEKINSFKLIK